MKQEWCDEDPAWLQREVIVNISSWLLLTLYLLWWGYVFMDTSSQWLMTRETPFPFILTKRWQPQSRANFQIVFLCFLIDQKEFQNDVLHADESKVWCCEVPNFSALTWTIEMKENFVFSN